jgi:hypothetical protein
MGAKNRLRAAMAVRYAAVHGGLVFRLKHVRTRDLLEVGFAQLEGDRALAELQKEQRAERKMAKMDATQQARMAEIQKRQMVAYFEKVGARPSSAVAFEQRMDAYVCAAVVGVGQLTGEALAQLDLSDEKPVVPLGSDFDPEKWCQPDEDTGLHIEPLRFVADEQDADNEDLMWVESLPALHRGALGAYVMAQSKGVGAALKPFPLRARGADEDLSSLPDGGEVAA